MLAAHSIYWKVEDYKTESRMHVDIEWKKMATALSSTLSYY